MDDRETLVADFDQELAVTRRLLARLPDASFTWKPHEKSYTLGALATHLARLLHWGTQILEHDSYDLAAAGGQRVPLDTLPDVLALFDRYAAELRHVVTSRPAAALEQSWSLTRGGQTILTLPRGAAVRRFCLQHLIHHRGQLTVYLRLLDVPLPPIYGPTADEPA